MKIFKSVASLQLASLQAGQNVSTRSELDQVIPDNGRMYTIRTLQEVRDAKGDQAWVPDEEKGVTLANGNVAMQDREYSKFGLGESALELETVDVNTVDVVGYKAVSSTSDNIPVPEDGYVHTAGASTLPATPEGYLTVSVNGTARKIPYYA